LYYILAVKKKGGSLEGGSWQKSVEGNTVERWKIDRVIINRPAMRVSVSSLLLLLLLFFFYFFFLIMTRRDKKALHNGDLLESEWSVLRVKVNLVKPKWSSEL